MPLKDTVFVPSKMLWIVVQVSLFSPTAIQTNALHYSSGTCSGRSFFIFPQALTANTFGHLLCLPAWQNCFGLSENAIACAAGSFLCGMSPPTAITRSSLGVALNERIEDASVGQQNECWAAHQVSERIDDVDLTCHFSHGRYRVVWPCVNPLVSVFVSMHMHKRNKRLEILGWGVHKLPHL